MRPYCWAVSLADKGSAAARDSRWGSVVLGMTDIHAAECLAHWHELPSMLPAAGSFFQLLFQLPQLPQGLFSGQQAALLSKPGLQCNLQGAGQSKLTQTYHPYPMPPTLD